MPRKLCQWEAERALRSKQAQRAQGASWGRGAGAEGRRRRTCDGDEAPLLLERHSGRLKVVLNVGDGLHQGGKGPAGAAGVARSLRVAAHCSIGALGGRRAGRRCGHTARPWMAGPMWRRPRKSSAMQQRCAPGSGHGSRRGRSCRCGPTLLRMSHDLHAVQAARCMQCKLQARAAPTALMEVVRKSTADCSPSGALLSAEGTVASWVARSAACSALTPGTCCSAASTAAGPGTGAGGGWPRLHAGRAPGRPAQMQGHTRKATCRLEAAACQAPPETTALCAASKQAPLTARGQRAGHQQRASLGMQRCSGHSGQGACPRPPPRVPAAPAARAWLVAGQHLGGCGEVLRLLLQHCERRNRVLHLSMRGGWVGRGGMRATARAQATPRSRRAAKAAGGDRGRCAQWLRTACSTALEACPHTLECRWCAQPTPPPTTLPPLPLTHLPCYPSTHTPPFLTRDCALSTKSQKSLTVVSVSVIEDAMPQADTAGSAASTRVRHGRL